MASVAIFAAVRVEPELFDHFLEALVATSRKDRKQVTVVDVGVDAYADWAGIDADEALTSEDALVIGALLARVAALGDLRESGQYMPDMGDDPLRARVIEAACAATLIERDGGPAFQLLDFLAHVAGGR